MTSNIFYQGFGLPSDQLDYVFDFLIPGIQEEATVFILINSGEFIPCKSWFKWKLCSTINFVYDKTPTEMCASMEITSI